MSDVLPDLLARVLGILLLATLVAWALRRQSASVRALAWTVALAGTLLVPALSLSSPRVELPILESEAIETPATTTEAASDRVAPLEAGSIPVEATLNRIAVTPASRTPIAPLASNVAPTIESAAPIAPSINRRVDLLALLLGAWMLGAFALLARLVVSHVRLGRVVRRSTRAEDAWRAVVDDTRRTLGVDRRVQVRCSSEIDVPAVAGIFSPVLLLPIEDEWTESERRDVALHELAHVARWDALSQVIGAIASAAYWFIPLVWYGARQAALLREQACDNIVLGAGTRPATYAERLIALARAPRAATLEPVALAMARPARLQRRVLGILDPATRRTKLSARRTAAVVGLAFAFLALVAVVQPVAAEVAGAREESEPTGHATPVSMATPVIAVTTIERAEPPVAPPTPLSDEAEQQQARPRSPLCRGEVDQTSINRNSDDDDGYWRLTAKGPGCDISVRVEGEPTFNAAFTDVTNISGRGTFDVDATVEGVRRELQLRDEGDRIARTYRVDGRERPYDAEAAAWFGEFLIALDRQTAFAVDTRLPILLRQGGVAAVLDETGRMPSDYARSAYYKALSQARRLSTGELRQVLDQAAALMRSDYYAAELLKAIARQDLTDASVRAGVMRVIEGMDSDYYRSESVKATVSAGPARNEEIDLLLRVVNSMKSDYYKSETVKLLLATSQLTPSQLAQSLTVVAGMKSDYHISELLSGLSKRGTMSPAERRAYIDAASRIKSDYYRSESLKGLIASGAPTADEREAFLRTVSEMDSDHYQSEVYDRLLAVRTLGEADLLAIEGAARAIESDHYHSQVLRRIATHAGATAAVSDAVSATAEGLSRHYRDEVQRAVRR